MPRHRPRPGGPVMPRAVAAGVQSELLDPKAEPDAASGRHSVLLTLGVTSAGFASTPLCRNAAEEGNDDGRAGLAGGAVPGSPPPPAGSGLPDARLAHRGR